MKLGSIPYLSVWVECVIKSTWRVLKPALIHANALVAALVLLAPLGPLGGYNPPPVAPASATSGAVFLRRMLTATLNDQTNSISVGADGAGGMHAAFANISTDTNGYFHAYYDYCAPGQDCANTANWTLVNLLSVLSTTATIDAMQLAVNAQGHPRMVIVTTDQAGFFPDHYNYAACDNGCTNAANWTIGDVADLAIGNNQSIANGNKHFFALDPQGRPRFVLDNGVNFEYHSCNTACTTAGNWSALTLSGSPDTTMGDNTPALAFNSAGQPRLLAPVQDNAFTTHLTYWECNTSDCGTNANSWSTASLVSPFISVLAASYSSLRVTHTGQPRFAYYGTPNGSAESLYYYWCQSACTSGANWHFSSVGLVPRVGNESSGQEPDLALDSQDHPRLSFQTVDHTLGDGLGYAWCDLNCESGNPTWQKLLADSDDQLNTDWPRLPPLGCNNPIWIGGYRSALVLDTAGNPRIGHDAGHFSDCAVEDYRTVRFVYFPGNTQPGPYRLYLPLAVK